MADPLVSVICLCYNHEKFVRTAIQSVFDQTYKNIEVIVVDDRSSDNSRSVIADLVALHPSIRFFPNDSNMGICAAFNRGWKEARGDYIIDFATDDVMRPNRIEQQVGLFTALDQTYGVVFTDAAYIDEEGKPIRLHYEYLRRKRLLRGDIPQGDVYRHVLSTYFICSPTMMSRRSVFENLGGYDEALAYEDFDFWVRSSRNFKYAFLDSVTTDVRRARDSMSSRWYQTGDKQVHSTYLVCRKAEALNRSEEDRAALKHRLLFEIRQCVFSEQHEEADLFYRFLISLGYRSYISGFYLYLSRVGLPLRRLRTLYHRLRYGAG